MATSRSGQRRRSSSSPSRQKTRKQSRSSQGERKPLQGRDTGYRVGSSRRQKSSRTINPRLVIAGVIGLLLIILMVFGISSCIRGCSKPKEKEPEEVQVNPNDSRVAYGVSAEETKKLTTVLDRNEAFAKIAKNADKITDERLIDLAIAEPTAVEFVAGAIKTDGSTQPFDGAVPQGEIPLLFTYDARWGYMPYADGILGVTGSGPVALSMASMGLSGKTTFDPATVAKAVTADKLANGTTGMDDSFVANHATEAGVTATSVEASSDGIYGPIAEGQPVLIKLKSDSGVGSANAHWALVVSLNSDNSVTIYDPTSAIASSHSWSLGAVSSRTDTAYSLAVATAADQTTTTTTDQTTTTDSGEAGDTAQ